MVRSGRARRKTLPRTSAQSPRQLERTSLFSPSPFFSLSPSSQLLACTPVRSSSFLVPLPLPPFSLYIFLTFSFYILGSSCPPSPFHQRHPLRIVSSSSFPLALYLFFSLLSVPYLRFLALFLSHLPLSIFHFFLIANRAIRSKA